MKKGIFLIGVITLATLLFVQEGKADIPETQKVHNSLEEIQKQEGKLKLELIYEWSSEDEMDENKIFYEPKDVAISEGRLFLLALTRVKNFEERKVGITLAAMSGDGKRTWDVKMKYDVDPTETDLYQILVFNNSGEIIASKKLNIFADNIKIYKDRLFLIDTNVNMKIYEYRITID